MRISPRYRSHKPPCTIGEICLRNHQLLNVSWIVAATEPQLLDLNGIVVVDLELMDLIVAAVTEPNLLDLIWQRR